jgi:hypothetical protein
VGPDQDEEVERESVAGERVWLEVRRMAAAAAREGGRVRRQLRWKLRS